MDKIPPPPPGLPEQPTEKSVAFEQGETIQISKNAPQRVWERLFLNNETRFCQCGREIINVRKRGGQIRLVHGDDWFNPITCAFWGTITDEMRSRFDAKTNP